MKYLKSFKSLNWLLFFLIIFSPTFSAANKFKGDESESDQFIQRVKELSRIDVKDIRGKDITLLVGPAGAGKSTLLNIIAGSTMTCKMNKSGKWEVQADPDVAPIGHKGSETFFPNYWQDPLSGNRFYDCPGFTDTRGIDYDIAKSYFLRTIADSAQSLKVILVTDIHTLNAVRGGAFADVVQQINSFIPDFNLTTDSNLIVTKTTEDDDPSTIFYTLNEMNWSYEESKITLLPKPNKSSGKLPYLDLPKIISGAPSIQKKCNIPLSNEAKLKISDLKDEFSQDIKEALTIFSQRVNLGYLDLIQSHLDVSHETLAKWYTSFKDIESKLKELCRVEDFQKGWEESITRLKTFHNSRIGKPLV